MVIDISQAKSELKELTNQLYYPARNGVRKVKDLPVIDKILLFESIQTLSNYIKQNNG